MSDESRVREVVYAPNYWPMRTDGGEWNGLCSDGPHTYGEYSVCYLRKDGLPREMAEALGAAKEVIDAAALAAQIALRALETDGEAAAWRAYKKALEEMDAPKLRAVQLAALLSRWAALDQDKEGGA